MIALVLAAALAAAGAQPAGDVVAEITVQGNLVTPDAEVRSLAGLRVGMPVGPDTVSEARTRLEATKKFRSVEVRKRFASIADPTQIAIVILVDEGAVHVERTNDPGAPTRVVRDRGPRLMFLPILDTEDAYGFNYGVRFALPNPMGKTSRISFPLTWGGDRQAAIEFDKQLDTAKLVRFTGGGGVSQRTNPFYDAHDTRARLWGRAEREIVRNVRVGTTASWQQVAFERLDDAAETGAPVAADTHDTFGTFGADVVADTRLDPFLARNAVYARAAWEHVAFGTDASVDRIELDGRGYVGLFKQNVLVVRAYKSDASAPLPPSLQALLGGVGTVRGFGNGSRAGDTMVAGSMEVLVPLTSPLGVARLGVSAFVDAGAAYGKGERFTDQSLERGIGGTVWVTAAFVRFSLAVAHGLGGSTHVQAGGTVGF